MNALEKVSPTAAALTSGSFKSALPGVVGAGVGYVAWSKLFHKGPTDAFKQMKVAVRGPGYRAPVVGAVAGVAVSEAFKGTSTVVSGALGVAGAAFLPRYMRKVSKHVRGSFMSNVGLPLVGYTAGKLVASMLGK